MHKQTSTNGTETCMSSSSRGTKYLTAWATSRRSLILLIPKYVDWPSFSNPNQIRKDIESSIRQQVYQTYRGPYKHSIELQLDKNHSSWSLPPRSQWLSSWPQLLWNLRFTNAHPIISCESAVFGLGSFWKDVLDIHWNPNRLLPGSCRALRLEANPWMLRPQMQIYHPRITFKRWMRMCIYIYIWQRCIYTHKRFPLLYNEVASQYIIIVYMVMFLSRLVKPKRS